MKEKYGCNLKKVEIGSYWDVYAILNAEIESKSGTWSELGGPTFILEVEKIYSEDYKDEWEEEDIDTSSVGSDFLIDAWQFELYRQQSNREVWDKFSGLKEFTQKFFKNPVGAIVTYILDKSIIPTFGDFPQYLANSITFTNTNLAYRPILIQQNNSLNEYVNIGEYIKEDSNYKYQVNIESEDEETIDEDEEYSKFPVGTKIPLIEAELYNMANNSIDMLNINFFETNELNINSPWEYLRIFTSNVIHGAIYIGIAFLITTLIYHSVQIIRYSISNPTAKKEHMDGIKKFAISTLMIVGTVIIMSLTIYSVRMILKDVLIENSKELPIRVHVEEAEYSFSTNITGYFKYMSQIEGVYYWTTKAVYAIAYIVLAWVNLIMSILMVCRMVILLILSILGAIIATLYAINIEWPMKYKTWIKIYISFSIIQVFIAIAYRFFLIVFE